MSIADELQQLRQLHESGALSDEEFAKAKQAVLNAALREPSKVAGKEPASIRDHLQKPAPAPASPQRHGASTQPGAPDTPPVKPVLAYDPVAPRLAHLEPEERHLYTFTIVPFIYKQASFFPPRIPAWYPDGTRFIWHLTDRRVLVEPYEIGKTEGSVMKWLLALGNLNRVGKLAGKATSQDWEAGQQQMQKMEGQWCAIPYTQIAKVERQSVLPQLGKMAKLIFKNPEIQPLVFQCGAANAGLFKFWPYSKDFVAVMSQLLES
jgi:hypothetical protein